MNGNSLQNAPSFPKSSRNSLRKRLMPFARKWPRSSARGMVPLFLGVAGTAALLHQTLFGLATRNHKMIVLAIAAPWSGRHVLSVHELPIGNVSWLQPKVIAHRG